MKRVLFYVLSGLLCFILLSCEKEKFLNEDPEESVLGKYELSVDEAKNILLSFMGDEVKTKSSSTVNIIDHKKHEYEVNSIYTRSGEYVDEIIPVYEFIIKEDDQKGFALVAADKRINSVLAYIPKGSFSEGLENDYFEQFITELPFFLKTNLEQFEAISTNSQIRDFLIQSSDIVAKSTNEDYEPWPDIVVGFNELYSCYLTTEWDQEYPYNSKVPMDCTRSENSIFPQNAPAGCVPIAIAQIMAFHRLGQYDWDLLLEKSVVKGNESINKINEIGQLLYDVGLKVNAKYSCSGTSAYVNTYIYLMRDYGYKYYYYDVAKKSIYDYFNNRSYTSSSHHTDFIRENIKQNHPVFAATSRHAYVIEAYAVKNYPIEIMIGFDPIAIELESIYYRINAGAGGSFSGWYLNLNNYLYHTLYNPLIFTTISSISKDEYLCILIDEAELMNTNISTLSVGFDSSILVPSNN